MNVPLLQREYIEMNWVDYTIIAIIVLSVVISLIRGFVREALSLASWVLAFWVGFTFVNDLTPLLADKIDSVPVRTGLAFFALFVATLIISALISYLIIQIMEKTGLSGTDRLLGTLFGFGRGALIVALLLLLANFAAMQESGWWHNSVLVPYFQPLITWLAGLLPSDFAAPLPQ